MSAPVFTPGDWKRHQNIIEARDPETGVTLEIAQVLEDGDPKYAAQVEADGNVLAASKRLYFAAKEALEWHEAAFRGTESRFNAFDVADSLKAALAAADGR